ncbi:MAG: tetratricopeptide repeat protein [Candidatus Scalinduaceae bacterium]
MKFQNYTHKYHTPCHHRVILCLIVILISSILLCYRSWAETIEGNKSKHKSLINKIELAMDALYRMEVQKSEDIFDEAINEWPEDPLPYLFKGGLYLNMFRHRNNTTEEENRRLKEQIFYLNNKVIDIARKRIEEDPGDMTAYYCLGAANGNLGRFYILNGQWWKGFWKGKKGFKILEKVVKKDPNYVNAYLGLGIYHYFSATLPKIAKVLSFLLGGPKGDREKGINELKLVRDNSALLSTEARKILLRVFRWEEDRDGFYHTSKWLAEQYPKNPYFQISYIYGLTHNKQFNDARKQRDKVDSLLQNDPARLPLGVRVKYYRYSGLLSYHLGKYSRAVRSYQDAIKLARVKWPPERMWPEDYYYLATSYAGLEKEMEAFQYLRKAIKKGWEMDSLGKHPEWQPYNNNPEFINIIGK